LWLFKDLPKIIRDKEHSRISKGSQIFDKDFTEILANIFLKVAYKILGRSRKILEDLGLEKIIDMEIISILMLVDPKLKP